MLILILIIITRMPSIFEYVVNNAMYVNEGKEHIYHQYAHVQVKKEKNIEIENELKGITRTLTRCSAHKYHPQKIIIEKESDTEECNDGQ